MLKGSEVAAAPAQPTIPADAVAVSEQASRATKLFEEALAMQRNADAAPAALQSLLQSAYDAHLKAFGVADLQTARVGWQLASALLSQGLAAKAEPLLRTVLATREQLLPPTSDELFDVYADLCAVHLLRAPSAAQPSSEYDAAMKLALQAKHIVSVNANSSTSERFHSRMALISSRLGGIHRAMGDPVAARQCLERAFDTASRLQMDLPRNVRMYVHSCLELAADIAGQQMRDNRAAAKRDKKQSMETRAVVTPDETAAAAEVPSAALAAAPPAATRSAADLYGKAVSILKEQSLAELPLMAHAQAGLALQLMADAEALHQQQLLLPAATAAAPATDPSDPATPAVDRASRGKEARHQIQELLRRAVVLTTDAMQLYQRLGGDNSADVATMCYNLGGLYVRLDDVPSARPFLSRALRIRTKLFGLQHESVTRIRDELSRIERSGAGGGANIMLHSNSGAATARTSGKRSSLPLQSVPAQPLTGRKARNLVPSTARQHAAPVPPTAITPIVPPSRPGPSRTRAAAPSGSQSARGTGAAAVRTIKQATRPVAPSACPPPKIVVPVGSAEPVAPVQPSLPDHVPSAAENTSGLPLQQSDPSRAAGLPAAASGADLGVTISTPVTVLRKVPSQAKLLTFVPAAIAPVPQEPEASSTPPTMTPVTAANVATVSAPTPAVAATSAAAPSAAPAPSRPTIVIRRSSAESMLAIAASPAAPVVALPVGVPAIPTAAAAAVAARPGSAKVYVISRSASKAALPVAKVESSDTSSTAAVPAPVAAAATPALSVTRSHGVYKIQLRPRSAVRLAADSPAASATVAPSSTTSHAIELTGSDAHDAPTLVPAPAADAPTSVQPVTAAVTELDAVAPP